MDITGLHDFSRDRPGNQVVHTASGFRMLHSTNPVPFLPQTVPKLRVCSLGTFKYGTEIAHVL